MSNRYKIVEAFNVQHLCVLQLDRKFSSITTMYAVIDGQKYKYMRNSIDCWIIIEAKGVFKGRMVEFV